MKKAVKIGVIAFGVFLTIFISGLVFVQSQIKKKDIRELIVKNIEGNLRDVKVDIGEIDYSLGFSVEFEIEDLVLKNKSSRNKLLSLKELEINIPLLAILTSGGTIDIGSDSLEVFVHTKRGEMNWMEVLPEKQPVTDKKEEVETTVNIEVPSFVKKSKINIALKGIKLLLNDEGKKSKVHVSKLMIKNLNLKKSTAYEVRTSLEYDLGDKKLISKIKAIGELNLSEMLEKGNMSTGVTVNISKTKLGDMDIPNVQGKVNVNKIKDKLEGKLNLKVGSFMSFKSAYSFISQKITLTNMDFNLEGKKLSEEKLNILNAVKEVVDFNGFELNGSGSVGINMANKSFHPGINLKSKGAIALKGIKGLRPEISFSGDIVKESFIFKTEVAVASGVATGVVRTKLNPLKLPSKIENFNPINLDFKVSNINLSKAQIQSMLYSGEKKKEAVEETEATSAPEYNLMLPPMHIKLVGSNIKLGKSNLRWDGKILAHKNTVTMNDFTYAQDKGSISITSKSSFLGSKLKNDFTFGMKKISANSFNSFLPPYLKDIEGTFSGSVSGNLNLGKKPSYSIKNNLKATNGELKGLDLNKMLTSLFSESKLIKKAAGAKQVNISDRFDKFEIKSHATEKRVKLNTFVLEGNKKSSKLKLKGEVSMLDKNSKLDGALYVQSLEKTLKREVNTKDLPIRLKGKGFVLLPDLGYTTGKLASSKGKQVIKKEGDKLKKKLEKKAKDLLKGFKL